MANFNGEHVTKLTQLYNMLMGLWNSAKGLFATQAELTRVEQSIPDAQVQSDWDETDTDSKAYIKHKPTIPDAQIQSDWDQSNSSAVDYIKNKPVLSTVAHTGDYEDLLNKPTINNVPTVSSSDDEKVLTASYEGGVGSYSWQDAPISLPDSTSADAGKVLTVDSNGDAAWQDSQGLVYVTYGTTPFNTVKSFADSGRVVYCVVNNSRMAFLAYRYSDFIEFQYYRSNPSGADSVFVYTVSRTGGWTTETRAVEKTQSNWNATSTTSAAYIKNKPDLSVYATNTALNNGLATKQDTISDLSTIRSGAAAGATAVQPGDLAAIATTGSWNDLVNVPNDLVQDASYVHTDNNFTTAEKDKLSGIAAGAEVNVQSDWTQNDTSADDYIKHKPALYGLVPGTGINIELNQSEQVVISANNDPQVQSDWTETNTASKAYIQNKPVLARVATTGSYNDLINKPTLNSVPNVASSDNGKVLTAEYSGGVGSYSWQVAPISLPPSTSSDEGKSLVVDSNGDPYWVIVQSDWNQTNNAANDYIKNKPTNMPLKAGNRISFAYVDDQLEISAAAASQVQSDWNASSGVAEILNKPNIPSGEALVPAHSSSDSGKVLGVNSSGNTEWVTAGSGGTQVQSNWTESDPTAVSYIQNKPNLATVATSGSYNDLTNTPTIPAAQVNADWNSSSGVSEILNKPNLATVATSGSYNDLSNKPTIPTLATLNTAGITDIQQVAALPASPVATVLYLIPES